MCCPAGRCMCRCAHHIWHSAGWVGSWGEWLGAWLACMRRASRTPSPGILVAGAVGQDPRCGLPSGRCSPTAAAITRPPPLCAHWSQKHYQREAAEQLAAARRRHGGDAAAVQREGRRLEAAREAAVRGELSLFVEQVRG